MLNLCKVSIVLAGAVIVAACGGGGSSGDTDEMPLVDITENTDMETDGPVVMEAEPIDPTGFIDAVSVDGAQSVFLAGEPPEQVGAITVDPFPTGEEGVQFISGGSLLLPVTSDTPFSTLYVTSDDEGYFLIRLPAETTSTSLVINYSPVQLDGEQGSINVQAENAGGEVSAPATQSVTALVVGTGELQVSVSWDSPTDVDLHLFEPDGTEIFFFNTTSDSGGMLDLDSNPACFIDGVNNENITYEGVTPPSGEYTVAVTYFSACGITAPTNFVVTVRLGDMVETIQETLLPSDESALLEVATFVVP